MNSILFNAQKSFIGTISQRIKGEIIKIYCWLLAWLEVGISAKTKEKTADIFALKMVLLFFLFALNDIKTLLNLLRSFISLATSGDKTCQWNTNIIDHMRPMNGLCVNSRYLFCCQQTIIGSLIPMACEVHASWWRKCLKAFLKLSAT